jgi:hypothetical protein
MKKLPIDFIKKAIEEKGGKLDKNWMCPTVKRVINGKHVGIGYKNLERPLKLIFKESPF